MFIFDTNLSIANKNQRMYCKTMQLCWKTKTRIYFELKPIYCCTDNICFTFLLQLAFTVSAILWANFSSWNLLRKSHKGSWILKYVGKIEKKFINYYQSLIKPQNIQQSSLKALQTLKEISCLWNADHSAKLPSSVVLGAILIATLNLK